MSDLPKSDELLENLDHKMAKTDWMDTPINIRPGMYCYASNPKSVETLGLPNARPWNPLDDDWKLPENWQQIIHEGFKERLERFRSFKIFMDVCVRCGACADKCHFFIGTGDPKNMPVLRAELLRSVYRNDFTTLGKLLGRIGGARPMTLDVLKEWWYYLFQCTECRRCSVFCPYGIDTAEITIMGRELLNLIGLNIDWIATPVSNCYQTGNHLGIQPHAFKDMLDFFVEDIEEITGVNVEPSFNKKGADILFITPSGDVFADPGTYTCMGYMMLFKYLKDKYGLDITWSTYASEGGNFGFFTSHETMKRLNAKMYAEAKRLGVKWILGGECGHMWRVISQYMETMNGPADFLEAPVSPITGTLFENARQTKMVHISEFTADLIKHGKLELDTSRNDKHIVTFHDSCNPARGMGMLDEPRYVIRNTCNHFYDMPANTIRENTFCCGSGAGLNAGEDMELRMCGGLPRANAVKYVHEKHGVNMLACVCAIDRAALPALMEYWVPEVDVTGVTELVANALILPGEKERETDLRGEPLPGMEEE
ncbi:MULTISPECIES: sulfate reduction electron transfer complex DsrMKJOP subunit DsrK [Desulfococcus]|uniref:4Fe-4S ferredoxin, iron-sulpur binding domain-containing protein n=1 Tax=Desulfococcus multivorans DSM 2059 TaxID=1121405 RepID=S7TVR5_DESML|nr:(Fe-S)-binding protein [Desulfococcus multivorans]AOY60340.1 DsrK: predicted redox complex linked to DsrAB, iron-sulfur binding subunit [Desulfococcus multivorans]AQV02444.1 menaquinol oxidoreductase [Desulfococcus multivorans]EPR41126.1 4Fe-4S ferredoxin, iron-sulpur binding domain-containing protein [Desulfococcus multivorans DSM 2059]SJZ59282.1 putative sulfite reductase-associated electron transfer protein DsrK [Desulfococcus multivorans DSM 2059]